jgi:hypothetical protein
VIRGANATVKRHDFNRAVKRAAIAAAVMLALRLYGAFARPFDAAIWYAENLVSVLFNFHGPRLR